MSGQSLSDTARAFVEAFNSGEWKRYETILTPDCVYDEVGTGRRAEGREAIVELFQGSGVPRARPFTSNLPGSTQGCDIEH